MLLLVQSAVAQGDDGRWLREARRAQERFETVRRAHLPVERSVGSARCDALIGRYCYWHDSTQTMSVEPQRIAAARAELLGVLDTAAAAIVADGWITGQRVRYLIEGRRMDDAIDVARRCRAERWQCLAFEGLALHVAERYAEADSAFQLAIREMSSDRRCDWLDLRRLVDGGGRLERELSRASCEERVALANRLFDLSRPLWSMPGNDLRTEHFARLTMAEILAQSANAHAMAWSGDSRELLVRYGWSEWYTRTGDDPSSLYHESRVRGHDRQPSYRFFPDIESIHTPPRIDSTAWQLRDPLARSRYAPRYLKRLSDLTHQLVRFPRGDSMLVAAVYGVPPWDVALARDTLTAWMTTRAPAPDAAPLVRARADGGALLATVPAESLIVSIEVRGKATSQAMRARYSVDPFSCEARWCLSDLLLFRPSGDSLKEGLESALATAATEMTFSRRRPLGVLWEIQSGGAASAPRAVWLELTVSRVRVSAVRRLASRLKLAPTIAPVRIRWQAMVRSTREAQHVEVRLPASSSGRYRVQLTVEAAGVPTMTTSRDIEVRP